MANVVLNSHVASTFTNEEVICNNIIQVFGQAMINHDVPKLKELFDDLFANVLGNFHDEKVIKILNKISDILFELNWNDWSDQCIDEYINALGNGESRLMAKYS